MFCTPNSIFRNRLHKRKWHYYCASSMLFSSYGMPKITFIWLLKEVIEGIKQNKLEKEKKRKRTGSS